MITAMIINTDGVLTIFSVYVRYLKSYSLRQLSERCTTINLIMFLHYNLNIINLISLIAEEIYVLIN